MSYSYLLDLYQMLDDRITLINDELSQDNPQPGNQHYQHGRVECLTDFKTYLREHYHDKLPRRIQKSYESAQSKK